MQHIHQLWITRLFNDFLAAPANSLLGALRIAHDPKRPWSDWMTCEILVVIFVLVFFAYVRRRLSVDKPSALQHTLELTYEFIHGQTIEAAGESALKYLPFFGT
ncbi:MAG: F0F1 ATP synthase subunit A, partial [Bryobacteraceae bacterium]